MIISINLEDPRQSGGRKRPEIIIRARDMRELELELVSILTRIPRPERQEFIDHFCDGGLRIERLFDTGGLSKSEVQRLIVETALRLNLKHPVTMSRGAPRVVAVPPGYKFAAILSFLLTREAYRRFVEPAIADMQHEYIEALAAGRLWQARWIAIRGYLLVIPGWLYALVAGKLGELSRRER